LGEIGVEGMTVTEVKGFAVKKVTQKFIAAANTPWIFCQRLKIEVVLPDNLVSAAVEAIIKAAKTGKIGDGKVFRQPSGKCHSHPKRKKLANLQSKEFPLV
jgi:nitrogen regulatory protein P-II 1